MISSILLHVCMCVWKIWKGMWPNFRLWWPVWWEFGWLNLVIVFLSLHLIVAKKPSKEHVLFLLLGHNAILNKWIKGSLLYTSGNSCHWVKTHPYAVISVSSSFCAVRPQWPGFFHHDMEVSLEWVWKHSKFAWTFFCLSIICKNPGGTGEYIIWVLDPSDPIL